MNTHCQRAALPHCSSQTNISNSINNIHLRIHPQLQLTHYPLQATNPHLVIVLIVPAPSNMSTQNPNLQTLFEGLALLAAFLNLGLVLWKYKGKFCVQIYRQRYRQRPFELEAQVPEVCILVRPIAK